MTHTLCINDENKNTQRWWLNFLLGFCLLPPEVADVKAQLQKWGASINYSDAGYSDTIIFNTKQDMVWFLLRWS